MVERALPRIRPGQLPLQFPYKPGLTAADFLPHAGVALALGYLEAPATWAQGRLAIWGQGGTGKSHLLHIWAHERGAALIEGSALHEPFWPEGPVAIDDADRAPSEHALLHVLNAAAETGRTLLLTTTHAPARLGLRLPDLASRMRAITAVEIGAADETFLAELFARLLSERQLQVEPDVRAWIMLRLPRTAASVREAAARLDYAALAAKKAVTERFAAAALADLFTTPLPAPTVEETTP